ncbi:hypothetical protein KAU11_08640, partial [Candidatus Babeliales bacterium]|nr:hypothetical protein [Candidatus Babeliales bacterium]
MAEFTPDYLNIDFNTYISKLQQELQQSDIFRDFDYEGSNITVLVELMAYFGDINTYFINKIAKNVYMETADIYECVNRLARQVGYEPKGTRGSRGTLTTTVSGCSTGDIITVQPWKMVNSGRSTDDGESITFSTTTSQSVTCTGASETFGIDIRQGTVQNLDGFRGTDIIENELLLPSDYAYDDDLNDDSPSILLVVNDITEWERTRDFYDDLITAEEGDDVYMFVYDRYRRNKILFNSARNVPGLEDVIDITALVSLGSDGNISEDSTDDTWSIDDDQFIFNQTTMLYIDNSLITVSLSAGTSGGAEPETITEIKNNSQSALRAQFRDVTKNDYNSYLSSRSDIIKATAYGEQDIAPSGSVQNYNIVRIVTIPQVWGNQTISTSAGIMTTDWGVSGATIVPLLYSTAWETELIEFLRDRKMISAFEIFIVPDLMYFSFEFGVRIKRTFTFVDVAADVLNKLVYFFRQENQEFNSEMDFNDVLEYLLDTSIQSDDDDFANIAGIRNLNMR